MKLLMIEDNNEVVEAMGLCFKLRWPEAIATRAATGASGLELLQSQAFDIVILDINLPDTDGFDLLQRIRRFSVVPVIILSVRGKEEEQARGLESGADDYIVKPFRPRELVARVNAVLRRANLAQAVHESPTITRGRLTLNLASNEMRLGDHADRLTPTESLLLYTLMKNAGATVDSKAIMEEVWGKDCGDTDILRTYIRRLRTRINDDPPQIVLTDHGTGYRFVNPR